MAKMVNGGIPFAGKQMQVLMKAKRGLVEKGSKDAITSVVCCLEHPQKYVRSAAVEALPKVCARGDTECIDQLLRLLLDQKAATTRDAAVEALGAMSVKGDAETVGRLVCLCRAAPTTACKASVIDALERIADRGQKSALDFLIRLSETSSSTFVCKCAAGRGGGRERVAGETLGGGRGYGGLRNVCVLMGQLSS